MSSVVNEIGHIVQLLRENTDKGVFVMNGGSIESINGDTSVTSFDCPIVINCDLCLKVEGLSDGEYNYSVMTPFYYYGNKKEIARILEVKDKNIQKASRMKYPAIILEQPFDVIPVSDEEINATIRLLLVTGSNNSDTYVQRYQKNFPDYLCPMYEKLKTALKKANWVSSYRILRVTERPKYTEEKLVSNDFWDVIDLTIELKILNNNCKKNIQCQ